MPGVLSDITLTEGQFLVHQTTYFVSCSQSFNIVSFFQTFGLLLWVLCHFPDRVPSHTITQLDNAGSCKKSEDTYYSFSNFFLLIECVDQLHLVNWGPCVLSFAMLVALLYVWQCRFAWSVGCLAHHFVTD